MNQAERWLHQEVWLQLESERRRGNLDCVVVPVPNGVFIPTRTEEERRLVARIIARMKAEGQLLPGVADLLVLWSLGSGAIELKRPAERMLFGKVPAGRPSGLQKDFAALCKAHGVWHAYATSWEEVRAKLVAWGRLR